MILIEQSVETPRSSSIAARSLVGPTSRRPCRHANLKEVPKINNVQYLRIPSRILKGASHEEVVNDETNEAMFDILNVWSVETPKYPAWLQEVWQSHSRHADLRRV
jgi:hypothetical protein